MNPEHKKDILAKTEIINRFDDESMFVRFSTLSKENKEMLDLALNSEGLSIGQIENIIRMADE